MTERRGAAERIVDAFTAGQVDVLVGTSLVTKGLDVPEVTLVGVVSSDVALNLPDERAAERTYQLLSQAVGPSRSRRSGGAGDPPDVSADHPVIRAVAAGDGTPFYTAELELRRRFGSPPFGSLVKLTVALPDRGAAEAAGEEMAARLRERASGRGTVVIGPAPAYIARRNDRWRYHLILRGDDPVGVLGDEPGPPWSVTSTRSRCSSRSS